MEMKKKIIIFTGDNYWISNILLSSFAPYLIERGFRVFVVMNGTKLNCFYQYLKSLYRFVYFFKYFNEIDWSNSLSRAFFFPTCFFVKKHNFEYVYITQKEFKNNEFEIFIKTLKPDYGLSFAWPYKFPKNIIELFQSIINYHNGILPYYRGTYSTQWSIYNNESFTGYSYHLISEDIDAGPVLIARSAPISSAKSSFAHELHKTIIASNDGSELINEYILGKRIASEKVSTKKGTYYSLKDFENITNITNPSKLEVSEINRRAKIFGFVNIQANGDWLMNVKEVKEKKRLLIRKYTFKTKFNDYAQVRNLCSFMLNKYLISFKNAIKYIFFVRK